MRKGNLLKAKTNPKTLTQPHHKPDSLHLLVFHFLGNGVSQSVTLIYSSLLISSSSSFVFSGPWKYLLQPVSNPTCYLLPPVVVAHIVCFSLQSHRSETPPRIARQIQHSAFEKSCSFFVFFLFCTWHKTRPSSMRFFHHYLIIFSLCQALLSKSPCTVQYQRTVPHRF